MTQRIGIVIPMPRTTINPNEETTRISLRIPRSLETLIQIQSKKERRTKSDFLRQLIEHQNLFKQVCHDLIYLFNNLSDDPTIDRFLELLSKIDIEKVDKVKEILKK